MGHWTTGYVVGFSGQRTRIETVMPYLTAEALRVTHQNRASLAAITCCHNTSDRSTEGYHAIPMNPLHRDNLSDFTSEATSHVARLAGCKPVA